MEYRRIIQIEDYLISDEILTEYFACDYEKCKGVCCIIGISGAPLEKSEVDEIKKNYKFFLPQMQESGRETVERVGFSEIDYDGDIVTPLIDGVDECVYAAFDEQDNCFCAMEKCWFKGQGTFRKPISCWLYPIRVSNLSGGMKALNLHRWHICKDAFEKGKKENIRVFEFLREPLIHHFGRGFYAALEEAAKKYR